MRSFLFVEILQVTVNPTTASRIIGTSSYIIGCTVSGTPQATIWSWTKVLSDGSSETIAQGTNSAKYFVQNSATSPSLTIRNIQASDQATYTCIATNAAGSRQASSQLTVTGGKLMWEYISVFCFHSYSYHTIAELEKVLTRKC